MSAEVTDVTGTRDRLTPAEVAERVAEIHAGSGWVATEWFLSRPNGHVLLSADADGMWRVEIGGWPEVTVASLDAAMAAAEAALDGAA